MEIFQLYSRSHVKRSLRRFLHLSVILSTGVVSAQCMLGYTPPLGRPPKSRHPPGADSPPEHKSPCAAHAVRHGQQADGTHPTGMHNYRDLLIFPLLVPPIRNTRMIKLFVNRGHIRVLNDKTTDLDWYYSRLFWKLKFLIRDLLHCITTFVKNPLDLSGFIADTIVCGF